jgi:hypothetical protein
MLQFLINPKSTTGKLRGEVGFAADELPELPIHYRGGVGKVIRKGEGRVG